MRVNTLKKERQTALGKLAGLHNQLNKLGPAPSSPGHIGPVFLKNCAYSRPAGQEEGMLGSLILENMLGSAFLAAANDSGVAMQGGTLTQAALCADFGDIADAASEYMEDRHKSEQRFKPGAGKGSEAIDYGHKTHAFNTLARGQSPANENIDKDLHERMNIEAAMHDVISELNFLDSAINDGLDLPELAL